MTSRFLAWINFFASYILPQPLLSLASAKDRVIYNTRAKRLTRSRPAVNQQKDLASELPVAVKYSSHNRQIWPKNYYNIDSVRFGLVAMCWCQSLRKV